MRPEKGSALKRLLRHLTERDGDYTAPDISRDASISRHDTYRLIKKLTEKGVLQLRQPHRKGRAAVYTFNRATRRF